MHTILLGHYVEDQISGLRGYATQRIEFLSGALQFTVQPKSDDGKMLDAYSIDVQTLKVIDEPEKHLTQLVTPPANDIPIIPLGRTVRDMVNGFTGIATARATYINGCINYRVVPEFDQSNSNMLSNDESRWITSRVLQDIGTGIDANDISAPEVANGQGEKRSPGGPSTKAHRTQM